MRNFNSVLLKRLLIAIIFLTNCTVFSQLSKTHFIPPLTSAEFGNANPEEQYIYISTPSIVGVSYTIKPVGKPASSYISGVVSSSNSQEIYLGTGYGQLFIASPQTSVIVISSSFALKQFYLTT
jgi:hypothetical protein